MKDIKGYEGLYAVTSCGRVWSHKRKKFLKPSKNQDGYLQVILYKDKQPKCCRVNRLVAETYIPNPDNLSDVNHINENKEDNYINNLEWKSHKDNVNHGSCVARAAKSRQKPIYCVELDRVFESGQQAARELGLNAGSISSVLKGRYKATGGYHFEYAKT